MSGPRVVAFGGGHGLAASLSALRQVARDLTAVVTVADDGGSSGILRSELGALPPGDLRMALVALAADEPTAQLWATTAQHRFGGTGTLAGHPVGNLLLTGLAEVTGDVVRALDLVGQLLGTAGRVLPMSEQPLQIFADVIGLDPQDSAAISEVCGQVAVATTPGRVANVRLEPRQVSACPAAVEAVLAADWIVLGPGSWFTSVIPHLLVPELAAAISQSSARRLVALNLSPQHGETEGFSAATHLEVLAAHAPEFEADVVLVGRRSAEPDPVSLEGAVKSLGARLVVAHLGTDDGAPRHDPNRLAAAYRSIFADVERSDVE